MKYLLTLAGIIVLILNLSLSVFSYEHSTEAKKGVLELSGQKDFSQIKLSGEWIYFPDTLIDPKNIENALNTLNYSYIKVPVARKEFNRAFYGTYFLRVLTDTNSFPLVFSTRTIFSSANVYVNGKKVGEQGIPSNKKANSKPAFSLKVKEFNLMKNNTIVIQFSNYYKEKSGLTDDVYLTTPEKHIKQAAVVTLKFAVIIGTILFIIFQQINFYTLRHKNRTSFYFGITSLLIAIYIVFMSYYYLGVLFPKFNPDFVIHTKIWRVAYHLTVGFFMLYIHSLFPSVFNKKVLQIIVGYTLFSVIISLFTPLYYSSFNFNFFMLFTIFAGIYGVYVGIVGKLRKIEDSGLFLFGFALFFATVFNDVLHNLLIIHTMNLLDIGIFGMMLTQAQIINSKLNRSLKKSDELTAHLKYINTNLEQLVEQRTKEIEAQKTEIESQRDFAMSQHKLIASQKKTITDSINYAREIQQAVLSDERILQHCFSESFILYKPKDSVSGDFYWMRHLEMNGKPHLVFCVADCTGHGVPGALLSMLGMSLLTEITSRYSFKNAAEILELLKVKFKQTISNTSKHVNSSDGMHITLGIVNKETYELQHAGAFQALYHIRDNNVTKIKGTHTLIGDFMHDIPFENHTINLKKGDRLYLFTDGFADQIAKDGHTRFMQKRLIDLLLSYGDNDIFMQKDKLEYEFDLWKGNSEQIDDVLVMGLRV